MKPKCLILTVRIAIPVEAANVPAILERARNIVPGSAAAITGFETMYGAPAAWLASVSPKPAAKPRVRNRVAAKKAAAAATKPTPKRKRVRNRKPAAAKANGAAAATSQPAVAPAAAPTSIEGGQ